MPRLSALIKTVDKSSQRSSAKRIVTASSPHRANNAANEGQRDHQKHLFSSRLAASAKGRVSVVSYSVDTISKYNSFKTSKAKVEHDANSALCPPLTKPAIMHSKNYSLPLGSTLCSLAQSHELSSNSIVYQPISKQIAPTAITAYVASSEKIKEHNAFIAQSPLSRTSQIFKPPLEPKHAASDATRSRSDILHSALCNIVATNYHSRRVQNAAMLFLEIGGFSPRVINDEMKHYKKNPSQTSPNRKRPPCDVEKSTTSHYYSTFSDIAPPNIMLEISAPVFSDIDNLGIILDKRTNRDEKRLHHTGPPRHQPRSTFIHAMSESLPIDRVQPNGLLQSSSTGCLQPRKKPMEYQTFNLVPYFPEDSLTNDSEADSSSCSEIKCVSLTHRPPRIFCRSFSLPRRNLLINGQSLSSPENMEAAEMSSSLSHFSQPMASDSKRPSPDSLREENELRRIAKDAKLRKVQSFGEFTIPRRRKSKIVHFIPDFSCIKSSSPSPQNISAISELNEYHSINEKLGHVEAIGRSINNQHKVGSPHTYLSLEEAQHMLGLLYEDYYNGLGEVVKDRRYRGTRQMNHCSTYPYQMEKEKGYYNAQSNDYSMIEAIITHTQRPVLHSHGISRSIISYCNAPLHECRMGTVFDALSLGRNFLYIVDFSTDMDTYFPQVLALMLQEHPQKAHMAPSLIDNPPCVLPTDNLVINKTEMPILKIRRLFVDLSNSGLMDRAATVLNDCVNKRFFDLYILFTIQSFADSFDDINVWELDISWELGFKLCYRILYNNNDSHPIISWTPYGDVSYLISLAVFTGRCADGIFNSIDCKESLLYTLILNYSIYEATYILLSTYRRYEDKHGPSIFMESPRRSTKYSNSAKWQTGSIFEIFTADLPIRFNEQYPETNPLMETYSHEFCWLVGLQLTTDFRLFEAIGLLVQNSHISILIANLRRLKFLLILLIHLLHGYILSNISTIDTHKTVDNQPHAMLTPNKSTIKDPFLITNLLYAIGSILGILLDKKLAQEQFNLSLLSNSAEEIHLEVREAIYDLICLQSYCIRMLLFLLSHFLNGVELDMGAEVRDYGLISIYASPYQDLHGLVPPYILLHDVRCIYDHLDFILRPESIPAQHIVLKHYCASFLIRMIRSAISFNTISDLNSLLFMRNPLCLSVFWTLRKQPLASKYSLTHWYIDKFTQMTDRNFV